MGKYIVTVPPTMGQGSFKFKVSDNYGQTFREDALQDYNSARDHDGQPPIKRMPNGTEYARMYEYEIQGEYSNCGFECLTTEETFKAAKDQLKCYRDNEPGTSFKIVRKGL